MKDKPKCIDGTLAHHWIIENNSKGLRSKGTCKRCGLEKKDFSNDMYGARYAIGHLVKQAGGGIAYR